MGVAAALLPSLLSLLLVIAAAEAAGAEDAIIRPVAGAGNKGLGETLCCSNMTGYHECVQACFAFYPPEDAAKYCDPGCKEAYVCHSVSGDECPSEHNSSPDSVTTDSAAVGEVVSQVEAGKTICCFDVDLFLECFEDCSAHFPPQVAEIICNPRCKAEGHCFTISGDEECPFEHRSSSHDSTAVGEVVAQVKAGETLCCSNMTLFHECVEDCFAYFPPQDADKFCDPGCKEAYQCHTVSGDECPSGHRSSSHDSSANGNAVDHCILGCNSSVCNKMVTGVGRKGVVKHAVERCNNACYKFCTKQGVRTGTSTS